MAVRGVRHSRAVLRTLACGAALLFCLRSAVAGFTLPRLGRRGLIGAGLLASAQSANAATDNLVTLAVDVEGGDGPATEQVTIRLHKDWAPRGVKRFLELVSIGDLEDAAFYHVTKNGMHFGLPAEPSLPMAAIKDDLVRVSNTRGTISFLPSSYNGRVNELFINRKDNSRLDAAGIAPIGEVLGGGMDVLDRLYSGYGKMPSEEDVRREGNRYLDREFPKLPKIKAISLSQAA
eukprot:CAMPEP_0171059684 /NCGR_PEP_ID=MMETSP0766_2-20121228/3341_1 /TAXON_ID=439317 /ORGANISM="Gambierdiscus australes, Strain CAWD 149" /LENGTH=233 /DNA_ID=CAMNT_0011515161 /DNA_START=64 /DNA_END=765 /DNA_ORIENTATION=+